MLDYFQICCHRGLCVVRVNRSIMQYEREDADFESEGELCAAWLYRPEEPAMADADEPPVVVMAHGFAATREMRLPAFAERFAERGFAVLLFDYRSFGDSAGEPRNLVSPKRHVADWQAAVDHARSLSGVDDDRLAVWGTSFSAGHALVTAAREEVTAYVGQAPFLDGARTLAYLVEENGLSVGVEATKAALKDFARKYTFREPHYVPVVGQPDELAALNTPGSEAGYRALVPDDLQEEDWNRCPARILLTVGSYRPIESADRVDCPCLLVEASEDQLVPGSAVDATVRRLDDVERLRLDGDHFDPYIDLFERTVERETAFLERHLRG
jgi:dienelactone hydrolase